MRPDPYAFRGPVPFNQATPWFVAGGLLLFTILFFLPWHSAPADPAPSRLAFTGSTSKRLDWVNWCLGQNWGGGLTLRHRKPPDTGGRAARFDNPVRHVIVDVSDEGSRRLIRAYSRRGEPFSPRKREALDGCLTGAAAALGHPRNRNDR